MRRLLGDVLSQVHRPVEVEPVEQYHFLGVRSFGGGCFDAGERSGADTRYTRLHTVRADDFVYPKLMAWEGAFAVVPPAYDGYVVSPEFCTFVTDGSELDIRYLDLLFRRRETWDDIAGSSKGTNLRRRRLHPDQFLAWRITLPDLDEQRRLVAAVSGPLATAKALELRVRRLHDLAGAVPISAVHEMTQQDRWEGVRLGEVLTHERDETPVDPMSLYPNLGVYSFARGIFEKPPIDGTATSAKRLNRVRAGHFIYSRLFAFEGAYALVGAQFDKFFVSNEFPTFEIDRQRLDPLFLAAYFSSPSVWRELASTSTGLGLRRQRVQPERILDHVVSLPPVEEQRRIGRLYDLSRLIRTHVSLMDTRVTAITPSIINHAFAGKL